VNEGDARGVRHGERAPAVFNVTTARRFFHPRRGFYKRARALLRVRPIHDSPSPTTPLPQLTEGLGAMVDSSTAPVTHTDPANLLPPTAAPDAPAIKTVLQYLKDLSFESVRPFARQAADAPEPDFEVVVGVHSRKSDQEDYMVEFSIRAEARSGGKTIFLAELIYVGCFILTNIPEEQIEPVLHLQCAPLLFPYARQILDDAVQKGGYPALNIDVNAADYLALFRGHLERKKREAAAQAARADDNSTSA
jgi:preprotein translocase subunit SecB